MFSSSLYKFSFVILFVLSLAACSGTNTDTNANTSNSLNTDNTNSNISNPTNKTGVVTLNWLPPTENTDASSLTDLTSFNIYYGISANNLDNVITVSNPSLSTYLIENLSTNTTYYFAITAVSNTGQESNYSNTVSQYITG